MVEYNASGLAGFYATLKNLSVAVLKYGKEWSLKIALWVVLTVRRTQAFVVRTFRDYFLRKDLSKEELENQLWIIRLATKAITAFVLVNVLRVAVRLLRSKPL